MDSGSTYSLERDAGPLPEPPLEAPVRQQSPSGLGWPGGLWSLQQVLKGSRHLVPKALVIWDVLGVCDLSPTSWA